MDKQWAKLTNWNDHNSVIDDVNLRKYKPAEWNEQCALNYNCIILKNYNGNTRPALLLMTKSLIKKLIACTH